MLLACLVRGTAAEALPWYYPPHAGKPFVNPSLSPARALRSSVETRWRGQLVLWSGVVRSHSTLLPQETGAQGVPGRPEPTPEFSSKRSARHESFMALDTDSGVVPVHFRGRVLTLDHDRTGYSVAIKGNLVVEGGRVIGLEGHSVILLAPPQDFATAARRRDVATFLAWWIGFHNPGYVPALRAQIADYIVAEAHRNGLDPLFLASLIQIESAFHVNARSRSGAIGLGQLMPFTARGLGVNPYDPRQNVEGAARMLAGLVRSWTQAASPNPLGFSLASYNAGPTTVRHAGGIPAIPETTNYVYFIGLVHERMTAAALRAGVLQGTATSHT